MHIEYGDCTNSGYQCSSDWRSLEKAIPPPSAIVPRPRPPLPLQVRTGQLSSNIQRPTANAIKALDLGGRKTEKSSASRGVKRERDDDQAMVRPPLSQQQEEILQEVCTGTSAFVTGAAGTGKSILLQAIVKALRKRSSMKELVAVTATTGIAARLIKGCTLHSWAGCGLAKSSAQILAKRIESRLELQLRWQQTKVLVIDEGTSCNYCCLPYLTTLLVSMLDGLLFDVRIFSYYSTHLDAEYRLPIEIGRSSTSGQEIRTAFRRYPACLFR